MKTLEDIERRLREIVQMIVEDEVEFDRESSLADDIGINSIMTLSFFSLVEEEFNLHFNPRDYYQLSTFGNVLEYVYENQE